MPWKLRKAPKKDLYWVINTETKKKHSKEPLPKERATAQMKALYANVPAEGGGKYGRPDEYKFSYDYLNSKGKFAPSPNNPIINPMAGGIKYAKWGDINIPFYDEFDVVPPMAGSGFFDDVKNKYKEIKDKGAAFLTGTNYVGPFNRLDEEYLRTNPPTDKIDEGAMRHDLE